jgi:hypothetical protein
MNILRLDIVAGEVFPILPTKGMELRNSKGTKMTAA